jgi:glycerate kinase
MTEAITAGRVLVAPDKFKGTFSAEVVAEAVCAGLADGGRPALALPAADGGEGTLEALTDGFDLDLRAAHVHDPLGRPIEARYGLGGAGVAVVEVAAASGLGLIPAAERDPIAASSRGTGELILAAIAAGASSVYVAAGGSATTDGGAGAVAAIRDAGGLHGATLTVLCDVTTPFEDAARVFAPQKGATPEQVRTLSRRLVEQAAGLPRNPLGVPMTGAAGGLSGGLWAAFDAELVAGAAFVLDAIGFDRLAHEAIAVVTGEGCMDHQSLAGKVVSEVAARSRLQGVECHAFVGRNELSSGESTALGMRSVVEAGTLKALRAAGAQLARAIS